MQVVCIMLDPSQDLHIYIHMLYVSSICLYICSYASYKFYVGSMSRSIQVHMINANYMFYDRSKSRSNYTYVHMQVTCQIQNQIYIYMHVCKVDLCKFTLLDLVHTYMLMLKLYMPWDWTCHDYVICQFIIEVMFTHAQIYILTCFRLMII